MPEPDSSDFGRVMRFLSDLSLLHWLGSSVAGLAAIVVAFPLVPTEWPEVQRNAAIGLLFLVPFVGLLIAIKLGRWCMRWMNRPTVEIQGYASSIEATARVTLHGAPAKVWLECRILDNSGPYKWNRTPFTPTWFYEGDAKMIRSQFDGTDAWLEDGKAASVMLSKIDANRVPWVRQPGGLAEDGGKPHAYVSIPIVTPDTEARVSYGIRAVASPPLKEKCEVTVHIVFNATTGYSIAVESTA